MAARAFLTGFTLPMIYRFIDDQGTFLVKDPQRYNLYFPLTDASGSLLSAIGPNLAGDIKRDNDHFLTLPASAEDLRSSPLCRREFFLKWGKKVIRLSQPHNDTVEAGFLYQKVSKRCPGGLAVEILNFIPHDMPVEVMRVRVTNRSSSTLPLTAFTFVPLFGRAEKNLRDHRHVSSLLNRIFLHPFGVTLRPTMIFDEKGHRENTTSYYALGYEGQRTPPRGQYPTLDAFLGDSDILSPDAVMKDIPPVVKKQPSFDGKEVCAGLRFGEAKLAPGQSREYTFLLGISDRETEIEKLFRRLDRPAKVEAVFEATKAYWRSCLAGLGFDFHDASRNGWIAWITLQPTLRRLFGCSFLPHFDYGKGGRGWRDLWQDALALLLTEPQKAGEIIDQSFRGVRLDGSNATIITKDGHFIADRNKINRVWMDHGVWPYLTTRLYVNRTGDLDFLLAGQTYFRDHQLERARAVDRAFAQQDFLQRDARGKVYRGSVLEHILVQSLVQFFNVGAHNVTRLENADWNDGMDMAADKGESVVFSFMYAHNLRDIIYFLEALRRTRSSVPLMKELLLLLDRAGGKRVDYDDYRAKQARLRQYFAQTGMVSGTKAEVPLDRLIDDLRQKWEHACSWLRQKEWLPEGFFNGYYDNSGRRVEGTKSGAVRMTLPAQVFAIMSGVASEDQVRKIWAALNRNLRDPRLGGFRLNTDFGSIQMELGRAFGFSYGDKENGAFFNHMAVMLANALYSRGFVGEGREVFDSIRKMAMAEEACIPPVLPEYFNSEGKGLYLYLTGSASWYVYTLAQEILGVKFLLGDLVLEPKLLPEDIAKGEVSVRLAFDRKTLQIRYRLQARSCRREKQPLKVARVTLRGRAILPEARGWVIKKSLFVDGINRIDAILE